MVISLGGTGIAVFLIYNHGWSQLTFGNEESICPDNGERPYCTSSISLWILEATLLLGMSHTVCAIDFGRSAFFKSSPILEAIQNFNGVVNSLIKTYCLAMTFIKVIRLVSR